MKLAPSLRTYAIATASRRPTSRSTPMEYSSVRGARVSGSSCRLILGSTTETMLRVAAGRRIEVGRRRDRRRTGVERAELSGQHALAESPVARPQHRPAIGA